MSVRVYRPYRTPKGFKQDSPNFKHSVVFEPSLYWAIRLDAQGQGVTFAEAVRRALTKHYETTE